MSNKLLYLKYSLRNVCLVVFKHYEILKFNFSKITDN